VAPTVLGDAGAPSLLDAAWLTPTSMLLPTSVITSFYRARQTVRWSYCFFWIICIQFACRCHWATCTVCTEPHASRSICRSVSVITFWVILNAQNVFHQPFKYSLNLFLKRGTAFFCEKFSDVFSSATFDSETVLASYEEKDATNFPSTVWTFQKNFVRRSPDMISAGEVSNLES